MVFVFAVGLIPSNGAGAFLIVLRFLKPTLRLYSRKNKMAEFHERTFAEEEEEENGKEAAAHGEGGGMPRENAAPREEEIIGPEEFNHILGADP